MAVISAVFGGIAGCVTIGQAFLLYVAAGICTTIGLLTVFTTAFWCKTSLARATSAAHGPETGEINAQTAG